MNPDTAHTLEYTPASGPRRRVRFEPRADVDGWWRYTEAWVNAECGWHTEGREPVDDLALDDRTDADRAGATLR